MTEETFYTNWTPEQYQTYLKGASALEFVKAYKAQSYQLMDAQPGHKILDVGCGNGDDVRALAQIVGVEGLVTGVDHSQEMIDAANSHEGNVGLSVRFQIGDVQHLDFADDTFDGSRVDRALQHIPDRERALAEMRRVTRPGGWIVAVDPDWETAILDGAPDYALTRRIIDYVGDHVPIHPRSGRQLYALFKQADLVDVYVFPSTIAVTDFDVAAALLMLRPSVQQMIETGEVAEAVGAGWLNRLQEAHDGGHFFGSMTGFTVCGRKSKCRKSK